MSVGASYRLLQTTTTAAAWPTTPNPNCVRGCAALTLTAAQTTAGMTYVPTPTPLDEG
jgi:hypothetical protein